MKNVSFGQLIVKKEMPKLTKHQIKVDYMAGEYLESNLPESNYLTSVEREVADNMYSDILVIHRKDGNTEIKLIENEDQKKSYSVEWFHVDPKDKKPLIIRAKDSYGAIQKKLAKYAEKLKKLSSEYYTKIINDPRFCENDKNNATVYPELILSELEK